MTFLQTLLASPPSTPLSRYTAWNGAFYMANGVVLYAWPAVLPTLLGAAPFVGREEGLVRVLGFTLFAIGWFYLMGARTRAASFALSTVVDRALVPLALLPLVFSGAVERMLVAPFAVLDPILAVVAYVLWRRTR